MPDRERNAAEVHAQGAGVEACVHEETGHEVRGDWLAVDRGDEHALMPGALHPLLAAIAEKMSETGGGLRAFRLVGGKEDEDVGIVAAEPGDELAVAQDDFGIGGAG